MRARNIKPSFFINEELAELPPMTRLLFIGYWCLADSKGVLEYRPKRIKAEIFPYDDCNIHDMTLQLVTCNCMQLLEIDGYGQFLKVVNFEKHQNPHPNEKKKDGQPYKLLENNDSLHVITSHDKSVANRADIRNPDIRKEDIRNNPPTPLRGLVDVPDFIDGDVWLDWVKHRTEIRKKLTKTQAEKQIAKLEAWYHQGHDPNQILTQSIANGWQGLFEPKESKNETESERIKRGLQEWVDGR